MALRQKRISKHVSLDERIIIWRARSTVNANGCWVWTGVVDGAGYAYASVKGIRRNLHRIIYFHLHPNADNDLELDHLCREPRCWNPSHLELVSHQENVHRGNAGKRLAARSHCVNGHEFTIENTRIYHKSDTCMQRICVLCQRQNSYRYYHVKGKFMRETKEVRP